jgi:hypothetical protein
MRAGRGFAVSAGKDLIVANDDENHAGGAGLNEEIGAERVNGLDVGERWWDIRLPESRRERQHQQEDKQGAREFSVAHSCCQFLGYKTQRLLKAEIKSSAGGSPDGFSRRSFQ